MTTHSCKSHFQRQAIQLVLAAANEPLIIIFVTVVIVMTIIIISI